MAVGQCSCTSTFLDAPNQKENKDDRKMGQVTKEEIARPCRDKIRKVKVKNKVREFKDNKKGSEKRD